MNKIQQYEIKGNSPQRITNISLERLTAISQKMLHNT